MAAETIYGDGYVNNPNDFPYSQVEAKKSEGRQKLALSTLEVTAAAETASQYLFTKVRSSVVPNIFGGYLHHDNLSTSVTLDITVVKTSTGSAFTTQTAASVSAAGSFLLFGNGIEDATKELWEIAGMASDPNEDLEIRAVLGSAGTAAAGTLTLEMPFAISG